MSNSESDSLPSAVRPIREGAAPFTPSESEIEADPKSRGDGSLARRFTTRLRMQRVTLMPFVPASLHGYVERVRERRRLKWVLVLAIAVVPVMAWVVLRDGLREAPSIPAAADLGEIDSTAAALPSSRTVPVTGTARAFVAPPAPAVPSNTHSEPAPEARSKPQEKNSGVQPTPPAEKKRHEVPLKLVPSSDKPTPPAPSSSWWY